MNNSTNFTNSVPESTSSFVHCFERHGTDSKRNATSSYANYG